MANRGQGIYSHSLVVKFGVVADFHLLFFRHASAVRPMCRILDIFLSSLCMRNSSKKSQVQQFLKKKAKKIYIDIGLWT